MAYTTPNLLLRVWNNLSDTFNHTELQDNWDNLDNHDHTPGKGLIIGTNAIANAAITNAKLAANSVQGLVIQDGSIVNAKLGSGSVTADKVASTIALDSQGLFSARPGSARSGTYYYATDIKTLYRYDGTNWQLIGADSTVSTLPSVGLESNRRVFYQSAGMATDGGIEWTLKYTGSGSFPWDFVGGSELYNYSSGLRAETLGSGSFVYQDALGNPSVTAPLHGDYYVTWGAKITVSDVGNAVNNAQLDIAVSDGTTTTFPLSVSLGLAGTVASETSSMGLLSQGYGLARINGVAAGATLKLRIAGSTTTASMYNTYDRWISAKPIRVAAS